MDRSLPTSLPNDATFYTLGRTLPRPTFLDVCDLGQLSNVNIACYRAVGSLLDSLGFDLLGHEQRDASGRDILFATDEEHSYFRNEWRCQMPDSEPDL